MRAPGSALIALQRSALDDLHPGWLPQLSAPLVERARSTPMGRRWLAQALAAAGVGLFRRLRTQADEDTSALGQPWPYQKLAHAHELLLDLGSAAAAPLLRAVVSRDEVLRLRRVLGARRYQHLLTRSGRAQPAPAEAVTAADERLLADDEALFSGLLRRGARELFAYAQQRGVVCGERVRLAFEPAWLERPLAASLPAEEVELQLSAHGGLRAAEIR